MLNCRVPFCEFVAFRYIASVNFTRAFSGRLLHTGSDFFGIYKPSKRGITRLFCLFSPLLSVRSQAKKTCVMYGLDITVDIIVRKGLLSYSELPNHTFQFYIFISRNIYIEYLNGYICEQDLVNAQTHLDPIL